MQISENIRWITEQPSKWKLYRNRSYRAKIQLANPQQIYNVPEQPGVVYNFLEDAYEKVGETGYVVTGAAGEMWPIGEKAVGKYRILPEDITNEPQEVETVELDTVYAAIRIPAEMPFTLETDYGEKALLRGNRPEIGHSAGDYVMVPAVLCGGVYQPDFQDSGRIINGAIFERLYRRFNGSAQPPHREGAAAGCTS